MKIVMDNNYGEINLQLIMSSLNVIEKILITDSQQDPQNDQQQQQQQQDQHPNMMKSLKLTEETINSFNQLYVKMSSELVKESPDLKIKDDASRYKYEIETFKRYN